MAKYDGPQRKQKVVDKHGNRVTRIVGSNPVDDVPEPPVPAEKYESPFGNKQQDTVENSEQPTKEDAPQPASGGGGMLTEVGIEPDEKEAGWTLEQTETLANMGKGLGKARMLLMRHPESRGLLRRVFQELDSMLVKAEKDICSDPPRNPLLTLRATRGFATSELSGSGNRETREALMIIDKVEKMSEKIDREIQ